MKPAPVPEHLAGLFDLVLDAMVAQILEEQRAQESEQVEEGAS
jgi:hypothetical protein